MYFKLLQCFNICIRVNLKTYRPRGSKCSASEEELPGLKRDKERTLAG